MFVMIGATAVIKSPPNTYEMLLKNHVVTGMRCSAAIIANNGITLAEAEMNDRLYRACHAPLPSGANMSLSNLDFL